MVVGVLGAAQADVDRVDPDLRRPLHRQRPGQRVEAGLGRAVRRDAGRGPVRRDRRDVDDRAAGVLLCITALAAWAHEQRREQVEPDDLVVEARRRRRGVGARRAAGVVDQHVEPPVRRDDPRRRAPRPPRGRARRRRGGWSPAGLDLGAGAGHDGGAGLRGTPRVMPEPMPLVPPVTSTTRPDRSIGRAMAATLPSNCLVGSDRSRMSVSSTLRDDRIRVVTMDAPPVNALTVQGWFDVAAALDEAGADMDTHVVVLRAEGRGFNAGVDIKEMQNTTGFDALIGANKGCYAAFKAVYECARAGDRRGQRLLPRRRRRAGRQRRLRGGQRRRLLRRARGQPGRARRGHPHGPAGPPAPDAHPLLHRPHDQGGRPGAARLGARGGPPRPARRRRARGRRRHRRQGHPGDPGGQGGAQRHRPDRRQQELPVRAGLHDGAQPVRRQRRAARRLRGHGQGERSDQGTARQAHDHRRGRRRARRTG